MTRYKKEFRKRGFSLECDYPYLPYDNGLESIELKFENNQFRYSRYYVSIIIHDYYDSNYKLVNQIID